MDVRELTGCTGKQPFTTRAHANQAAARSGYRVYRCTFCTSWHLTGRRTVTTPPSKKRPDHREG